MLNMFRIVKFIDKILNKVSRGNLVGGNGRIINYLELL